MITVLSRSFRYALMLSLLRNSGILVKPPRLRYSPKLKSLPSSFVYSFSSLYTKWRILKLTKRLLCQLCIFLFLSFLSARFVKVKIFSNYSKSFQSNENFIYFENNFSLHLLVFKIQNSLNSFKNFSLNFSKFT